MFRKLFLTVLVFALSACQAGSSAPAAPTLTPAPTQNPTSTPAPEATATATETPTPEVLQPITIVEDLKDLSQADVVKDGEQADYAKRVLAAYKRGEIKNFDPKIVPPEMYLGNGGVFTIIGIRSAIAFDWKNYDMTNGRPMEGATIVQDGQGGIRVIQLWLQKDGTPGIVWYHLTKEFIKANPKIDISTVHKIFNLQPQFAVFPMEFKDERSCQLMGGYETRSASFCRDYMSKENVDLRNKAIQEWIDSGFVPWEIQSGQIEFQALRQSL